MPPLGAETTVVKPAPRHVSMRLSARVASPAASRQGVEPGRSSGPREIGGRGPPSPPAVGGAERRPMSVKESNKPGYTVSPLPSMNQASCGKVTSLPTAVITPREMTTVAFSMRGPDTGTTVAPRMANDCGSPPCAAIRGAAARATARVAMSASAGHHFRRRTEGIHDSLFWTARKDAIHKALFWQTERLGGSFRRVKEAKAIVAAK